MNFNTRLTLQGEGFKKKFYCKSVKIQRTVFFAIFMLLPLEGPNIGIPIHSKCEIRLSILLKKLDPKYQKENLRMCFKKCSIKYLHNAILCQLN